MSALLHVQSAGGHPHLCGIKEHFVEKDHYYVILDLIQGGEMFDHLVSNGAFSEMDAARVFRDVASALAFLHGIGVVHGDLKPENLMLSTSSSSDAAVKIVDFGSAQTLDSPPLSSDRGWTPAYCPPEMIDKRRRPQYIQPSMDMWAVGVILYIGLTGVHPYDLTGQASDEEVEKAILSKQPIPLRNSPITAHLSESAIDLLEKLIHFDRSSRLTAHEMLDHSWIRGETASTDKMAFSDKKLSSFRKFKSRLEAKVFADIVKWSDDEKDDSHKTSLLERSFRSFDPEQKGYITSDDLSELKDGTAKESEETEDMERPPLSLAGFHNLLSDSMKHRYFPKGHTIYKENDPGNTMYFINSGVVEVSTAFGSSTTRGPGNYFGEGALLDPSKRRSGTIRCKTPVHVMEISREYFEKYLVSSETGLLLSLREKDKIRKRNRLRTTLRLQPGLVERDFSHGDYVFRTGEREDKLFLVEYGTVDVLVDDRLVFRATSGNFCGEYSVLTKSPRNATGICTTKDGCILQEMLGRDFRKLADSSPGIKESIRDLSHRRSFKKAVVKRLKKEFPYENPREAFDAVAYNEEDLDADAIAGLMRDMDPGMTNEEIREIVNALDLRKNGRVSFDEFKKVFIADKRTAAAM